MCGCNATIPASTCPNCCTDTTACTSQPCGCEYEIDSACIRYRGNDLECSGINGGDTVETAIQKLDTLACSVTDGTDGASAYEIAVANGFVGTEAEWLLSINGDEAIVAAGDNVTVTPVTVGTTTTYTVDGMQTVVAAGAGVNVSAAVVGNDTTYTLSTTGFSSEAWAAGGLAGIGVVSIPVTLVANRKNIFQYSAGAGSTVILTTPASPSTGDQIEFIWDGTLSFKIKPGIAATGTTIGVWRDSGYLEADGDLNETLYWDMAVSPTKGVRIKLLCVSGTIGAVRWMVAEQTWNDQVITIV